MTISEGTVIDDFVPELQQLIVDAADATAMQFPAGNPTADALVALLDGQPATISPGSGLPGLTDFTITDPLGRITAGDFVVFYLPGNDPAVDGFLASVFSISPDGTELTGRVPPGGIPQGITYSVRVTPNDFTPRFDDLEFFVELGPTCPPNCGQEL